MLVVMFMYMLSFATKVDLGFVLHLFLRESLTLGDQVCRILYLNFGGCLLGAS